MNEISVTVDGQQLVVQSPFCPSFINKAYRLGGIWDETSKVWKFAAANEAEVRKALVATYGEDGREVERTDLLFTLLKNWQDSGVAEGKPPALYFAGRLVARMVKGKNEFRMAEGVVLRSGRVSARLGKYPQLCADVGAVFEMRGLPVTVLNPKFSGRDRFEIQVADGPAVVGDAPSAAREILALQTQLNDALEALKELKTVANRMQRKRKEGKFTAEFAEQELHALREVFSRHRLQDERPA